MCRQRAGCNAVTECLTRECYVQAKGRLQCWNADGLELSASGGVFQGFEAWQTAGSDALTREGYVQANGRLQCWNADGQELGASGAGF